MLPAGRAAVDAAKADGRWTAAYTPQSEAEVPPDLRAAIAADPAAQAMFEVLTKANRFSLFETSGFTGGINWYRNLDRNWRLLAAVDPIIHRPALMIYGDRDPVARSENLAEFVPNAEVVSLDCGHWIQQERPEETNQAILKWLDERDTAQGRCTRL